MHERLIAKTLRVPRVEGATGDGSAVARQLDAALLSAGFTCSRALLEHVAALHPAVASEAGETIIRAVRELVGDHVEHNAYFKDFPRNVPDTTEFWTACVADALLDPRSAGNVAQQLADGRLNLLDLPKYGRYQHTYEELLAAHEPLVAAAADRVTVLELGETLALESHRLYLQLASSTTPLSEADLELLGALAVLHVSDAQPDAVPVRESRALINAARLRAGPGLEIDTAVDVLRLACALSGGDVTLSEPTRFTAFPRAQRRALLAALDGVPAVDVLRYPERFKRLGERLHPHEYAARWPSALKAFAVARGERPEVRSIAGKVEIALGAGRHDLAVQALEPAPGMLVRAVDRLVREGAAVEEPLRRAVPHASLRVLLALREHLDNRASPAALRMFVNQRGRSWVTPDTRAPLPDTAALRAVLDAEIAARLPRLEVAEEARSLAVPLTAKGRPEGIGVLPRGSVLPVAEHVRFFIHWRQRARDTDYDLSVQLLDADFRLTAWVSWTNLAEHGATHSGDITEAPAGASEFIDLDLSQVQASYVVPQVHVYSGEPFGLAEEAFFGYMERTPEQAGRPFEPRTVRMKSDLNGGGRVALPLVFARGADGGWHAHWMHLFLTGQPDYNRVERHHRAASTLVRGIVERRYLRLADLEALTRANPGPVVHVDLQRAAELGLEAMRELPSTTPVE